jgi:hypothetical protein
MTKPKPPSPASNVYPSLDGTAAPARRPSDTLTSAEALHLLEPQLAAIPAEKLTVPNVKLDQLAVVCQGIDTANAEPAVIAAFARLHSTDFDASSVRTFHLCTRALSADALVPVVESKGRVTPEVGARATERRTRMLELQRYHLDEVPAAKLRLDALPTGNGYDHTAADLLVLAAIQEDHLGELKDDKRRYKATDVADARADAAEIERQLNAGGNGNRARDLSSRLFFLVMQTYENQILPAAAFVFRFDPVLQARYPEKLVAAARSSPVVAHDSGKPADPAPVTPPATDGTAPAEVKK